ncbi:hypothetical protein PRIPAC_84241 [Pristionchus pacificus]|uniref:Uncharacterized protein n=1 Tax=Pristionchus pacificus TaxID=54126 RepID=A0A2A6BSR4_PRIPA|nr:hypothetical protein PRIPAC_84241 [Pristionchus pacificus]|eukprot:PDM68915.1 hypothetical protein PRIPAC_47217 [Pristionchus pacificus]
MKEGKYANELHFAAKMQFKLDAISVNFEVSHGVARMQFYSSTLSSEKFSQASICSVTTYTELFLSELSNPPYVLWKDHVPSTCLSGVHNASSYLPFESPTDPSELECRVCTVFKDI